MPDRRTSWSSTETLAALHILRQDTRKSKTCEPFRHLQRRSFGCLALLHFPLCFIKGGMNFFRLVYRFSNLRGCFLLKYRWSSWGHLLDKILSWRSYLTLSNIALHVYPMYGEPGKRTKLWVRQTLTTNGFLVGCQVLRGSEGCPLAVRIFPRRPRG